MLCKLLFKKAIPQILHNFAHAKKGVEKEILLKIAKIFGKLQDELGKTNKEKEGLFTKFEKLESNYRLSVEKWKNCKERLNHSEKELRKAKELIGNMRSVQTVVTYETPVIRPITIKVRSDETENELNLSDVQFEDKHRVRTDSPFKDHKKLNLGVCPGVQDYVAT